MFLRPIFAVESTGQVVHTALNPQFAVAPKNMVFGQSGVSYQDSGSHSFYRIRLIFGYFVDNSIAYQKPKFHVRNIFAFGWALK